jgi:DNA polymerase-3 subunit gamma/tau
MRDAYTLFDQVVSFSGGNITAELIKEKLGLLGLDELNALADACGDNNTATALSVIDQTLEAGIAIEQFVIDLAGYYRSMLLIKAGITKESLLGYGADRFSRVWKKLSLPQLEEGLSILLDLYRDIRYSLSPRFELETAVSKLCWLDKWVSPPELRSAVEAARSVLDGQPTTASGRSVASAFIQDQRTSLSDYGGTGSSAASGNDAGGSDTGGSGNAETPMDKPGAVTEGFKQFLARKTEQQTPVINEDAETVRRVFKGTYINQDGNQ